MSITNYLDDFLFVEVSKERCNALVRSFLSLCKELQVPVSAEKTEWAARTVVFLGILLDGWNLVLSIPDEKEIKALSMLQTFVNKKKGYLNFLSRAIFPGRSFTR